MNFIPTPVSSYSMRQTGFVTTIPFPLDIMATIQEDVDSDNSRIGVH
jgi:hypothetical protein